MLPAHAVHAQDPGLGPNPHHEAARIIAAELAMDEATADLKALAAQQPSGLAETLRKELAIGPRGLRVSGRGTPGRAARL